MGQRPCKLSPATVTKGQPAEEEEEGINAVIRLQGDIGLCNQTATAPVSVNCRQIHGIGRR